MIFWKDCPEQIGSALMASLMCKSLAREAKFAGYLHLADKLILKVGLVIIFCCCLVNMVTQVLNDIIEALQALRTLYCTSVFSLRR